MGNLLPTRFCKFSGSLKPFTKQKRRRVGFQPTDNADRRCCLLFRLPERISAVTVG
ncbi:MAG: hypothetical protein IKX14_03720 [Neisseriaceae bacterium]|nr:hypothetical protein [Neisseriaceae bacterium]